MPSRFVPVMTVFRVLFIRLALVVLVAAGVMPASPSRAQPQDCEYGAFGCGHAEQHHQYLEWKPSTGKGSCCNGDDCRPVKARSEDDGSWSVWIPEFRQLGAGAGLRRRRARPVRRWPQPRLQHQADARRCRCFTSSASRRRGRRASTDHHLICESQLSPGAEVGPMMPQERSLAPLGMTASASQAPVIRDSRAARCFDSPPTLKLRRAFCFARHCGRVCSA